MSREQAAETKLGTGGAAPHGIVPYGNVAKTYAANTIASFINNGTAWVEVGRLT